MYTFLPDKVIVLKNTAVVVERLAWVGRAHAALVVVAAPLEHFAVLHLLGLELLPAASHFLDDLFLSQGLKPADVLAHREKLR